MIVTHKLDSTDLQRPGIEPRIHAVQDDKYSRNLEMPLFSGGVAWEIPADAAAVIRFRKPDGTGGTYDTLPDGTIAWNATGNLLTIALAPQVLTAAGPVSLAVTLIQGDKEISTFSVLLQVHRNVNAEITGSGNYVYVTRFLTSPASAKVGQYLQISNVDEKGHVTALEAVDMAGGVTTAYKTVDFDWASTTEFAGVAADGSGTVEIAEVAHDGYGYAIIPVSEGEVYRIEGMHYYMAFCYAVTDADTLILKADSASDDGETVIEEEITIPAGAKYLYVNKYGFTGLTRKTTVSTGSGSVLTGKKIVYDGDSIMESRIFSEDSEYAPLNNGGAFAKIIADLTGGTYENQAVGGARLVTLLDGYSYHSIVDNLPNLPADGDLYCFDGGVNDYWTDEVRLGTFDYTNFDGELDTTTVCGALETIFRYCLNTFVGKPVCFVIAHKCQGVAYSPDADGKTFKDYRDAMVGICEKYSIPYYDAFSESGLNGWNDAQNKQFLTASSTGEPDGCHPNEEGYKRYYVPQLISLFERIMPRDEVQTTEKWSVVSVDFSANEGKYAWCESIGAKPQILEQDGFSHAIIPVSEGERYKINNNHDYYCNSWFTVNSSGLCVREDSAGDGGCVAVQEEITIQAGETLLYVGSSGFVSLEKWS